MEKSSFKFSMKSLDPAGTFSGFASTYGNTDLGGDEIVAGAFAKTLADKGGEVPLLWAHNPSEPIGIAKLTDTAAGLQVAGKLILDGVPTAQKVYALMKAGVLKGLSIGYDVVRYDLADNVRRLLELKLWEISAVTFPMNERATVTAVKSTTAELEPAIRQFQALLAECRKSF
jgi:HK97 family phage prohead protease